MRDEKKGVDIKEVHSWSVFKRLLMFADLWTWTLWAISILESIGGRKLSRSRKDSIIFYAIMLSLNSFNPIR